ncbi:hypothetical protein OIDMADRAFT_21497 [Oidiodendron maius Zn]|uniref:Integrase catalytic domain-containing protein n=1 Tax=Oidiodendron maius (strain Zn) TaxID=913774 RepID=A0A0C3GC97_OIDMZ|nr:hypothetical protein OIDMADRAFT_21497 [Oidiodendron maius Zn]
MLSEITTPYIPEQNGVTEYINRTIFRLQDTNYLLDISHLYVLGYKVYINIPKERRVKSAKLAPYTEEGYLVGFEGSKIYCIYLPGRA